MKDEGIFGTNPIKPGPLASKLGAGGRLLMMTAPTLIR